MSGGEKLFTASPTIPGPSWLGGGVGVTMPFAEEARGVRVWRPGACTAASQRRHHSGTASVGVTVHSPNAAGSERHRYLFTKLTTGNVSFRHTLLSIVGGL